MKITGHGLQQAIREKKALLEVLDTQLSESTKAFEGEDKEDPLFLSSRVLETERSLVKLQCAQDIYNEYVVGSCMGETVSLGFAIKHVGGIGRMEKFWRNTAAPKRERHVYRENERSKDTEYAKSKVTSEAALLEHTRYSKIASALRAFIAKANTTEVDVTLLKISPEDFG